MQCHLPQHMQQHAAVGGSCRQHQRLPPPPRSSSSSRRFVARPAVERDVDWDPAIRRGPLTAPGRGAPPPPPQQPQQARVPWYEVPFASRRNIMATMLLGTGAVWVWNKKVLPPVAIGEPPAGFPFRLAGFTDVDPASFVYAKTPGGNWIASAQDEAGRLYIIDQAGDLYYDSGDAQIGIYALDTRGDLYNIYMQGGARRITPVGNISEMTRFKVNEIAGVKLDRDVNVVAMADGTALPLPPTSGMYDARGKFVPPGELIEGMTALDADEASSNPFARLFGRSGSSGSGGALGPTPHITVDPADPTSFERQVFDQTLLDDPDQPGFQPLLPRGFSLEDYARQVEAETQAKAARKRGLL